MLKVSENKQMVQRGGNRNVQRTYENLIGKQDSTNLKKGFNFLPIYLANIEKCLWCGDKSPLSLWLGSSTV